MFDASSKISRVTLSRQQLNSFVVKLDAKKGIDEFHRPIGGWPEHWIDKFHESEGGSDLFGQRPQDGQYICKEEILGMTVRNGQASAWDDVSEKYLEPELVEGQTSRA